MDALGIDIDLIQHDFTVGMPLGKSLPITYFITPNNKYDCLWSSFQYDLNSAHETWKTTVGFQVTRNIGNHFILTRQLATIIQCQ